MFEVKTIVGENKNVTKFVFTNDDVVAESVLYKYPTYQDRTVICCSTMSGCPVGCRFCLPSGEKIKTPNGMINIEDIRVGDSVNSFKENDLTMSVDEVTRVMSNDYCGDLIEIELENGEILRLTPNHEVLTNQGWKQSGELLETDEIVSI